MTPSRLALALPAAFALAVLAGCSGGASSDTAGSTAAGDTGAAATAPEKTAAGAALAQPAADDAGTSADRSYQASAVISKGSIELRSRDVDHARDELRPLLVGWGGVITNEQSATDKHGHTDRQHLEIRVPTRHFEAAMDRIPEVGTLVDRTRTSEDVTTQVIDTAARIQAQKASLARVQALLAEAGSINQVIAIEAQLTQRQAELDPLEQQRAYLADQTSMATIDLTITRSGKQAPPAEAGSGFLSGLEAGWDRLQDSTTAVLTAVGALLPFAVVAGAVAAPIWWSRRRRAAATEV